MSDLREELHDRLLVIRCQAGDPAALLELVKRHQAGLAYYLRKMLGEEAGVEDLLQDLWLDVLRRLPGLRDAAAFPAWVFRIARDHVHRELRRRGVRRQRPLDEVDPPGEEPEEAEFSADDVALVHICLDELSPEHREALVLRFLQAMSYEEMAAVAGCGVGTIRSRLHYAKSALRRAMERKRSS